MGVELGREAGVAAPRSPCVYMGEEETDWCGRWVVFRIKKCKILLGLLN